MNTATAKHDDSQFDENLQKLIMSARNVGYTEAVSAVTTLMLEVARLDDKDMILKRLAKGMDAIAMKGPTNA